MPEDRIENNFIQLIHEHQGILLKICRTYFENPDDQQDIYQDMLLNAWKSFSSFRMESKFSTWLYKVSINTALSNRRKPRIAFSELNEQLNTINTDAGKREETEIDYLYKAIHLLTDLEKTIILLYLEQLSYNEIADITGLASATVGIRINRIKKKLKPILIQYGIE